MRVGLDFDNTLAGYDHVFSVAGRAAGVLPADFVGGKAAVKAFCHSLPDGETQWMRLQGRVYGAHMGEARLIEGVDAFLRRAQACGAQLVVVSHKTEFGHFDPDRINLREVARLWMRNQGFFDKTGYGFQEDDIHFESTRHDKVARIAALGLDHFVDDLIEVFEEPGFPRPVRRHLFTNGSPAPAGDWEAFSAWDDLRLRLFP